MDRQTALKQMLANLRAGNGVLTSSVVVEGVPSMHTFAGKYRHTVEHRGMGSFRGYTEHGVFGFDGGGWMYTVLGESGAYLWAWTVLTATPEVLGDLGYNVEAAERGLTAALEREA